MVRTGKGGYRPTKQKPAPGAWIRGAKVRSRAKITANLEIGRKAEWLEEGPKAGLMRYIRHGRNEKE